MHPSPAQYSLREAPEKVISLITIATSSHSETTAPETTALSLMLAVIASSEAPLVLLDGELRIIAASAVPIPRAV